MKLDKKKNGFTLIEIIIALAILGIVTTAAASLIGTMRHMENDSEIVQNANVLIQNTVDKIKAMSMNELREYTKDIKNSQPANPFQGDYKIEGEKTVGSSIYTKINKIYSISEDFKVYSTSMDDIFIAVKIPNANADKLGIDIISHSDKSDKEYWFDKDKADGIITFIKDEDKLKVDIKNKNLDNTTWEKLEQPIDISKDKYLKVINTYENGTGHKLSYNKLESKITSKTITGNESERNIYIVNKAGDSKLIVKVENKAHKDLNVYIENMLEKGSELQIIPKGDNIKIYSQNSSEGKYGRYGFKNVCEIIVEAYYVNEKIDEPKLIHSIKTYKIIDKD